MTTKYTTIAARTDYVTTAWLSEGKGSLSVVTAVMSAEKVFNEM